MEPPHHEPGNGANSLFADRCRQAAHRARVVAEIARGRWADPDTIPVLRATLAGHLDAAAALLEAAPPAGGAGLPAKARR